MGFDNSDAPAQVVQDTGIVRLEKWDKKQRRTVAKDYTTVPLRIQQFWADPKHEGWSILTKLIYCSEEVVRVRARIYNKEGIPVASGHAEEIRGSSDVNTSSAVENCETSAVGRALGNLGYAGTQFASAEEVTGAVEKQDRFAKIREDFLPIFEEIARSGMAHLEECWMAPKKCVDPEVGKDLTAIEVKRALQKDLPRLKEIAARADNAAVDPARVEELPWENGNG